MSVVALALILAVAQVASANPIPYGTVVGCCPGEVVEQKTVVNRQVEVPYSYSVPVFSRQCQQRTNIARSVVPRTSSSDRCQTLDTTIVTPSTSIELQEQPLCKKTCTTSEYILQIPVVETVCTNTPLCQKTARSQNNVVTTVSKKVACTKNTCTQNQIINTPITDTVCQKYESLVPKVGYRTVVKPEVVTSCKQLPPYRCLKSVAPGPAPYVAADYAAGYIADAPGYATGCIADAPGYAAGYIADAPGYAAGYIADAPGYATGYIADAPGCTSGYAGYAVDAPAYIPTYSGYADAPGCGC